MPRTPLLTATVTRHGLPATNDVGAEMRTSDPPAREGEAPSPHTMAVTTRAADPYRIPFNGLLFAILRPQGPKASDAMLPPAGHALEGS